MGLHRARQHDCITPSIRGPTTSMCSTVTDRVWNINMEIEQRETTPECQRALFSAPTIMTETLQIQLLHIAQRWTFDMESGKYCQYSVITLES